MINVENPNFEDEFEAEIKTKEHRVAVTPEGVDQMREHGHEVFVETDAGNGSDF